MTNIKMHNIKKDILGITEYYRKLIVKTKHNQSIGSINEWVVDNYYVISEQEKYIINDFRSKTIKKINKDRKRQIYNLLYSVLKASDFQINISFLFDKLNKYQRDNKDYFSYYEINLIHVFIRLILISELNNLCKRIDVRLDQKEEIEKIFDLISEKDNEEEPFELTDYVKITDSIVRHPYYIEQLSYKLKELGQQADNAFIKLNEVLQKYSITVRELIEQSHNEMASDNFLMINLFGSLKKLAKYKMEYLYKNLSYTEKVLLSENDYTYPQIYDNNKMEYREKIITNAKKQKMSEYEYATLIVDKANNENKHIGWYLFKNENYMLRAYLYIFIILASTITISIFVSSYAGLLSLLILLIPISALVVEIINQILMHFDKVNSLFKLKFEDGLPKEYSTMVVIPTIVKNKKKVIQMLENLEVYYLSNKTNNIYFTLLGDCSSEMTKNVDFDKEIIEAGLNKVSELNEKYGKNLFYFVYRNRFYSKSEECYLGFERKRGALHHFNKLLLNELTEKEKKEYFNCHTFNSFNVPIKYVITLDTDTKLVLNTALKLIGCMAHPMNRPVLSKDGKKVISGYGIMQSRIGIDVEVTSKSQYSQLFAGLGGLDTYTTASFDLYQDVFNEGSFVGKGIYDLEVFNTVLSDAFPNNLILSHDLIEGNYLRCGFINDVELFDDYPSSYLNDALRHHRWNRGDWQIIGWLKKKVRNIKGEIVNNPINILSKWKIFDNLRRSLVSPFLLLIIFYGFTIGNGSANSYFALVCSIITVPIFFYLLSKVIYRNKYDIFLKYYLNLIKGLIAVVNKAFIVLAVLPYEAYLYVDSIIKSLYRMFISKKKLLNWVTAEEAEKTLKNNLTSYLVSFKLNYLCAMLLIICAAIFKPANINLASVIAIVWFFAPVLMYIISKKIEIKDKNLDKEEIDEIKSLASLTWKYFNDLLIEQYNYLIPDNYQLNREDKVDNKTSPTNIGFSITSAISAFELDFISLGKAMTVLTNIIKTVEKLEKWHGHLYNWYNIYTLKKMYPYFVSSVDNGNFIATLYVAKSFFKKHDNQEMLYRVTKIIDEMDFTKLYNTDLDVFSIGYNTSEQTLIPYNYNNFASESRLTSFIAIAKGDVPYKHWFCLDKALTKYKNYKGVASWSGTSFEYFMPLIFMKTYKHTLLDETYYYAYFAEREFMKEINADLPWGISESAYNELDDSENYKYASFGIPYLKLQDSVSYPIVISPYSSLMAISIDDREVYDNIDKFKKLNMFGTYGLYEAYDNEDGAIIKNFYAHHQGMILASLTNYLKDNVIQEYFHNDKNIESIDMLLKEKVQIKTYIDLKIAKYKKYQYIKETQLNDAREYDSLRDVPELGVLSNGFYSVVLNDRGVGLSKYKNLQVNRFRKITNDDYGLFMYIRNLSTNKLWTNTYAPLNTKSDCYKVIFASDRIKYIREDDGIITTTEVTVVKDHNAELRKITFKNNTDNDVILEVTSYGEVIMCRNEDDISHRAFNSLSIQSEVDNRTSSLIFNRKSRTKENTRYFIVNRMFLDKDDNASFEYETSRTNFLGQNNTVSNPKVILNKEELSMTIGAPIDPIMSIRKKVVIKAKSKAKLFLLVGFGKSREQVMEIVDAYKNEFLVERAFDIATVANNIKTSYANLTVGQMSLYNTMLKYIYQVLISSDRRKKMLEKNTLSYQTLWRFGISGDLPIIVVEINKIEDVGFIKEVLQMYEFYKVKTIYVDVVIINNEVDSKKEMISNYTNNLLYQINNQNYFENSLGSVYIINSSKINEEEKLLLNLVSMISLNASSDKSLGEQIESLSNQNGDKPKLITITEPKVLNVDIPKDIELYNDFGGFINDGKEYLISNINTPAPWINVLANDKFGTIVSNNGGGFSYAYNSREFKLTSWSNDITSDPASEALIINNTKFKSSLVKHGFGYTIFYSSMADYDISLKIFVSQTDKIKFYQLNVTNKLGSKQKIKFELALKMVLGVTEELTNRYLYTSFDKNQNCLYVKNVSNNTFKNTNVFISATEEIDDYADNVVTKNVAVSLDFDKKESKSFSFMLGCSEEENLLKKYDNNNKIDESFVHVTKYWDDLLSTIKVNTPDKTFNYVLNGWYLYQIYASRLLAKAGFYQVGGAIGFRDQLQDIMSIIYSNKELARLQILLHAKHQFESGDVLHWWHEDLMIGSRTKFSDDYLWLVYVTDEYIKITGDYSILSEQVCFVEGEELTSTESEKGITYQYTNKETSLYNHMKLCITKCLKQFGVHNLPLMGSGDWNDGMNKVGYKGKGESIFVSFFLYDILKRITEIAKEYNDFDFSDLCCEKRISLGEALTENAWDGSWYLRAYFDNGEPLGSRNNMECKIDLLCQVWSILSDFAPVDKKTQIFNAIEENLIDKNHKIIKLLTPAFDKSINNPGYIKDYTVGIRENGGQYTHAAMWYIMALLKENKVDKAYQYYQMINPINRTLTKKDVMTYKVEPYVIAADIYSNNLHLGRGGWTWYTGSASWAYKIGLEEILGFKKNGTHLTINPKINKDWDSYEITYKYLSTTYLISVQNKDHIASGKVEIKLDNKTLKDNIIKLVDDGEEHNVLVTMKEDL